MACEYVMYNQLEQIFKLSKLNRIFCLVKTMADYVVSYTVKKTKCFFEPKKKMELKRNLGK